MKDQEIRDLSETLEFYENLSANQNRTKDEQDNLDMAEYILLKSAKPLLEEVKKLKSEENKPMDELTKAGIELASSLGHVFHSLPKEAQKAYEAFQKAYVAEIGKKIPAVAVNVEMPILDGLNEDLQGFREELEKIAGELRELLDGFNGKREMFPNLQAEITFSIKEV